MLRIIYKINSKLTTNKALTQEFTIIAFSVCFVCHLVLLLLEYSHKELISRPIKLRIVNDWVNIHLVALWWLIDLNWPLLTRSDWPTDTVSVYVCLYVRVYATRMSQNVSSHPESTRRVFLRMHRTIMYQMTRLPPWTAKQRRELRHRHWEGSPLWPLVRCWTRIWARVTWRAWTSIGVCYETVVGGIRTTREEQLQPLKSIRCSGGTKYCPPFIPSTKRFTLHVRTPKHSFWVLCSFQECFDLSACEIMFL